MNTPQHPCRLWYILRYHRPSQLTWRAIKQVRHHWRRSLIARFFTFDPSASTTPAPAVRPNTGFARILDSRIAETPPETRVERRDQIRRGHLEFLNHQIDFGEQSFWGHNAVSSATHLWRFHLHYHNFLVDLAGFPGDRDTQDDLDYAWQVVSEWIDYYDSPERDHDVDAWHTFCISQRLPVWMCLWHCQEPPDVIGEKVLRSLIRQAFFLKRNLEWDLRGNHVLENLKALALAGAFFSDSSQSKSLAPGRWLDLAERLLPKQYQEQILPTGEHFERSPMYHAITLRSILDIRDAVASVRPTLAESSQRVARKMAEWLSAVLHPDGQIPLFSDSALDATPNVQVLLQRVAQRAEP